MGVRWCCWFHRRHVSASCARYFSPCSASCRCEREKVRPARPGMGASAKKFAQHTKNGSKWVFYGALGELLRGNAAGGAAPGEFFRGSAVVGSRRASLLCRVPGTGALLLAALTFQCAAKPYGWHGGQPAQATTYRVNVRIKGPRPPPIGPWQPPHGLACASKGFTRAGCFTEPEEGLTARRRPDAPLTPRRRRRRIPKGRASRCVRGPRLRH